MSASCLKDTLIDLLPAIIPGFYWFQLPASKPNYNKIAVGPVTAWTEQELNAMFSASQNILFLIERWWSYQKISSAFTIQKSFVLTAAYYMAK